MTINNSEQANSILDYSKMLVDSLGEDIPTGLKPIQYLVFAGMISYYGQNHYREVYGAFKNTDFVPVGSELTVDLNRWYITDKVKDKIKSTNPVAYYNYSYGRSGEEPVGRLFISSNSKFNMFDVVEGVTQEMNRVVNAINNTYVRRGSGKLLRTGLSERNLFSGESELSIFEDSVNALQTGEIMNHILEFANYDINDPELSVAVNMISSFRGRECKGLGYEFTKELIKPLYEDDVFGEVLKDARLSGEVGRVGSEFDSKAGRGRFEELTQACEYIEYGSCPEYVLDINGDRIKSLVKEYKAHK